MFAVIAIQVPLLLSPLLIAHPTRDCRLEVLAPQAVENRALSGFDVAVDEYARLHRRIARSLPMPPAFDTEDDFVTGELRDAIVAARPNVRRGMFFTPDVALFLQQRIDWAFLHHPGAAADATLRGGYDPLAGEAGPVVNQPFAPAVASVRWLPLVRALPALPPELEFALWGRDLVLVDVRANLVLDVLEEALPPAAGSIAFTPTAVSTLRPDASPSTPHPASCAHRQCSAAR